MLKIMNKQWTVYYLSAIFINLNIYTHFPVTAWTENFENFPAKHPEQNV